jgi:hypothetical protein
MKPKDETTALRKKQLQDRQQHKRQMKQRTAGTPEFVENPITNEVFTIVVKPATTGYASNSRYAIKRRKTTLQRKNAKI